MNSFLSVARRSIVPLIVMVAFGAAVLLEEKLPPVLQIAAPLLFYIAAALAVGVGWHFNRSRFVFIMVPLVLLFVALGTPDPVRRIFWMQAAALFVPLHLIVFTLLKERGIVSVWGLLRALFVIAETVAVVYLVMHPAELMRIVEVRVFHEAIGALTPVSDIALVQVIPAGIFFALIAFAHPHPIYPVSFAAILLLVLAGLHYSGGVLAALAFTGVALVILGALLVESYRLAFHDELTGLPGRRALMEDMAKLGRRYALAMVDIDHFKKFNDTYGHDTGDDVLRMVAKVLETVEGGGKAFRYGGEEFTVLFPSKTLEEAYIQMEKLRHKIAQSNFIVRGSGGKAEPKKVSIHISSGVVERRAEEKDPMGVMKRADNALYKAKQKGRNMVVKG